MHKIFIPLRGSISLTEQIKRLVFKSFICVSVLVSVFVFGVSSVFAVTHPFKYTPSDSYNLSTTYNTNLTSFTDSYGMQYWTKNSATSFIETDVPWVSGNVVTIFLEASSTFLSNQFYVDGTSTSIALPYTDSVKGATFLVDGRYISQYTLYTKSGYSLPDLRIYGSSISAGASSTQMNNRIYAVMNGSPSFTVNSSTTLLQLQQSWGCPYCAISLDWIGGDGVGITDTPVSLNASSSVYYQACGLTDIGGCFVNAGIFLFIPNQVSIQRFQQLTLASSSPFSYLYDMPLFVSELFNTSTTSTITLSASTTIGVITFLSPSMITAVPYVSTLKWLIGLLLFIATAETIFFQLRNMFTNIAQ